MRHNIKSSLTTFIFFFFLYISHSLAMENTDSVEFDEIFGSESSESGDIESIELKSNLPKNHIKRWSKKELEIVRVSYVALKKKDYSKMDKKLAKQFGRTIDAIRYQRWSKFGFSAYLSKEEWEKVIEISQNQKHKTHKSIADEFGVDESTISRILKNQTCKRRRAERNNK